jgi:hypothetical protein
MEAKFRTESALPNPILERREILEARLMLSRIEMAEPNLTIFLIEIEELIVA